MVAIVTRMSKKIQAMHVATTRREYKGKVYESHLLRRTYREDGKVKHETLANLSALPPAALAGLKLLLKGEELAPVSEVAETVSSRHHGHVRAVLTTMERLGFANMIASAPSRERDLVVAMVAARILDPHSKLATARSWHTSTLPGELGVEDATEDELYAAMDWLDARQNRIEKKLAARHLDEDGLVLYDLSSSYVEGSHCPLAALGHNRDGKKGKLQINYGLVTDSLGCPVGITVYPGNTSDSVTLVEHVELVKETWGIQNMAIVGDRGMISGKQIKELKQMGGVDWITALKTPNIRSLMADDYIQLGLFDEKNLFEFTHPDYPGERLVACRNPQLAKMRAYKRQDLIKDTLEELQKVQGMVISGKLRGQDQIGLRVGRVINKYKVAKHMGLDIQDDRFSFRVLDDQVAAEAALDGIYVIRTSLGAERLSTDDAVRSYKLLANVEKAFRSIKTVDLKVRPIHHRLEERVCAHLFLCMLAYYVEWHMKEAWREILFSDEDQEAQKTRDPVAPAQRSKAAIKKTQSRVLDDGTRVHSFQTLLTDLSTIVKNTCRRKQAPEGEATFTMTTLANPQQQRAFQLLEQIAV